MKKLLTVILAVLLLAALPAAYADTESEDSPEWISALGEARNAEQLFVVAGVGDTTATISMHEKDENGTWKQIMTTPGFIGKYGLGKQAEGDGKTPIGSFSFNYAFGIADDPGCALSYHKVTGDNYWSGDEREGYHYNEMVSIKDLPELNTDDSEHIVEYVQEYQYCLNISYNEDGTPGRGSAIFLHCFGPLKPYTGGCVAIPKNQMLTVMRHVRPDCVVVIDSLKNLSPALWEKLGLSNAKLTVDYGTSEIYTVKEMNAAITAIQAEFDTWEGCEMHSIRYAGDACDSEENLRWMKDLGNGKDYQECIEFVSDFHSPKEAYGAWEPDAEYTGWQWWLASTEGGDWELMTWGY